MENFIFTRTMENFNLNKIINKLTRTMESFIFKQNNKQTHQNNGKLHI